MGIEPTAQAWEAWVLPLYDARSERILARSLILRQPGSHREATSWTAEISYRASPASIAMRDCPMASISMSKSSRQMSASR